VKRLEDELTKYAKKLGLRYSRSLKVPKILILKQRKVFTRYPKLKDSVMRAANVLTSHNPRNQVTLDKLQWWLHEPFTTLAWEQMSRENTYDFLWVLEDDIGFAGNVEKFYNAMENKLRLLPELSDVDVFVATKEATPQLTEKRFNHGLFEHMNSGESWHPFIVKSRGVQAIEHLVGYSSKFINTITNLLEKGIFCYGEFFPATICDATQDCVILDATDWTHKEMWSFSDTRSTWARKRADKLWKKLLTSEAPTLFEEWYHGVKAMKVPHYEDIHLNVF
jgi:hypothetical protein